MEYLDIQFRDVARTGGLNRLVRRKARTLERYCDHITRCRVVVERPRRRKADADPHRVRIDITAPPGHELVVTEQSRSDERDDATALVHRAFEAAKRRLKELNERQNREVKTHAEPRGLVARLFPERGYGFLRSLDGRELYFHRNSVLGGGFERLEAGTEVRYEEEQGEKGPQASTVRVVAGTGTRSARVRGADAAVEGAPPPEQPD